MVEPYSDRTEMMTAMGRTALRQLSNDRVLACVLSPVEVSTPAGFWSESTTQQRLRERKA